jgi:hypothetical protein
MVVEIDIASMPIRSAALEGMCHSIAEQGSRVTGQTRSVRSLHNQIYQSASARLAV